MVLTCHMQAVPAKCALMITRHCEAMNEAMSDLTNYWPVSIDKDTWNQQWPMPAALPKVMIPTRLKAARGRIAVAHPSQEPASPT